MKIKIIRLLSALFLFIALSSCSDVNETTGSSTGDNSDRTQVEIDSQETITPTKMYTPVNETLSEILDPIAVPSGHHPIIDGTLSTGEWDDAAVETFADGSQLLLMQAEDYLYLGIKTHEHQPFACNVYILRGDKITVLHSSAALGTAIYQKAESNWQQTQNFNWQLRDTSNSESAQTERAAFLKTEGWLAANGNMGTPNELEYQIKIQEQNLRIAVVFTKSTSPYEKVPWPANLDDDTIIPTPGGFPSIMAFFPTRWGLIEFD